jgi:hypothetical protein
MPVNLSPAFVMGVILIFCVMGGARKGVVALVGVMFGVAIAGGMLGGFVREGNGMTTRMAGEGVGMVNGELGGGGGGVVAPAPAGPSATAPVSTQPPISLQTPGR